MTLQVEALRKAVNQWRWRVATEDDVDALVELVNGAYRGATGLRGWTTEARLIGGQRIDHEGLRGMLSKDGDAEKPCAILVATPMEDAHIVGCVYVAKTQGEGYLGMLTVDVERQSSGAGHFLLGLAERYVQDVFNCQVMGMTVISVRHELLAWYERRGYRKTGETQPFPYGNPRFGVPFQEGLYFEVLKKNLNTAI